MLQNQHVAIKINTIDQTVHVYACWEFITLHFQALNKLKMGTSLCDVTVTLKRQRKIVNIFFLKQNTFFYKKMYVWHFYQKMHTELHSGLHYLPVGVFAGFVTDQRSCLMRKHFTNMCIWINEPNMHV